MNKTMAFILASVPFVDRLPGLNQIYSVEILLTLLVFMIPVYYKKSIWILTPTFLLFAFMSIKEISIDTGQISGYKQAFSLLFAGIYALILYSYISRYGIKYLFKWILILNIINCILIIIAGWKPSLLTPLVSNVSAQGRYFGLVQFPMVRNAGLINHYGYLASLLILTFVVIRVTRHKLLTQVILYGILFSAVLVTQSRATYLSFIALLGANWAIKRRMDGTERISMINLSVVLGIVMYIGFAVFNFLIAVSYNSYTARTDQFSSVIMETFRGSFLTGFGFSNYFAMDLSEHVIHNMFLVIFFSLGLIGLLTYLIQVSIPIVRLLNSRNYILLSALLSSIIAYMASSGLSFYSFWLIFGIAICPISKISNV